MKVAISGVELNLPVTTVSLRPTGSDVMHVFRCVHCGEGAITQITGEVAKISPYDEPDDSLPVVSFCHKCKRRFAFQTHSEYTDPAVQVILHGTDTIQYFYCYRGRPHDPSLLSYMKGDVLSPTYECRTPGCNIVYAINYLL